MLIECEFEAGKERVDTVRHWDVRQPRPHEPHVVHVLPHSSVPNDRPASLNDPADWPRRIFRAGCVHALCLRAGCSFSCSGKPTADAREHSRGVVAIGRLADTGEIQEHEVPLDHEPPPIVAGAVGLDRLPQHLGQLSAGLEGPIMAAETFDELPQPRHPIAGDAARGCVRQRDGGGSRRKRIEFRPQGRRRLGEQFGKPPADPPRRREGDLGIGTVDNKAFHPQAVEARTINGGL